MRAIILSILGTLLLATIPVTAQQKKAPLPYKLEFNPRNVEISEKNAQGQHGLFVTVRFTVSLEAERVDEAMTYKVIIEENETKVKEEDVPRPTPSDDLAAVLAMDISGSTSQVIGGGKRRIDQAKRAAQAFFNALPAKADCGLVLFDHEIRKEETKAPPTDRILLKKLVDASQPRGGTAYLDAALRGISLLSPFTNKEKALVLMTDGVDLNSQSNLEEVIERARQSGVRIYTVGIGEAGKQEAVNTVMVLDRSGSMLAPAADEDKVQKIEAMRRAAARYVNSIGPTARSAVLQFSDSPFAASPFSNDKNNLKSIIQKIQAHGETALFDAVYDAVATLDADRAAGIRAVVALTDGIDNSSRRRVEEVIERAKEANIKLYLLGFGRPGELDEGVMKEMANKTKGEYYHATNEKALLQIFEKLSQQIHEDGIDEVALRKLAEKSGGRYYHAQDVSTLDFILKQVTKTLQRKEYVVTFASLLPKKHGTQRKIDIKLVRRSGELAADAVRGAYSVGGNGDEVVAVQTGGYQTKGLVLAEMNHFVYLAFLVLLGVLIALPAVFRRMFGTSG